MDPPVPNGNPDQKLPSLPTTNRGRSVPKAQFDRKRMRAPPTGPSVTGLDASEESLPLLDCIPPSNNIKKPEQKLISHTRVIKGEKIQYESFLSHVPPAGSSLTGASEVSLPLLDCFPPSNNIRKPEQKLTSHTKVNRGEKIQHEPFLTRVPPAGSSLIGASKMSLPRLSCFPPSNNIRRKQEPMLTSHRMVTKGEKIQFEPFLTRVPPAGSSLIGASKMSLPLLGRFTPSRPLQPRPPMSMKRTFSTEHSGKHLDLLVKNSTGLPRLNPKWRI
ncbi:uncharacterized protein [Paramisgurnus dabryanus]|uniref:uncharacterized protein n=1 Tax=Paramisgurnus dabryanus TaxID=90735 RepID=UPI0031F452A6